MSKDNEFKVWMKKVDAIMVSAIGLSSMDIADRCYYDMFEDQLTPEEVAGEVIDAIEAGNGFDFI